MFVVRLIVINLLIIALSPYLLYEKASRWLRKRNNHEFMPQRWTAEPPAPLPEFPEGATHVVFVGATYGEMLLMERLNNELARVRPDVRTTWVLRDRRTIEGLRKSRPNQALGYWPFEFFIPVMNWLRRHKPDVIVVTEKLWYPNLVLGSANYGAKVILFNGRTNPRTSVVRRLGLWYNRWVLAGYRTLCFQDKVHLERISHLLSPGADARVTGNIKYDYERPALSPEREASLAAWLEGSSEKPLVAAGSTDKPLEVAYVLDAFEIARQKSPCRLLLVPRDLNRLPELIEAAHARKLRISLRTEGPKDADVYLLDTLGELAYAYSFADAAYVGGTLTGAGHNVIEPLQWGIPVSYGPKEGHFIEIQRACEKEGVGFKTHTPQELADHWVRAVTDKAFREDIRQRSEHMIQTQRGATARTIAALVEVIDECHAERCVPASGNRMAASA